MRTAKKRGPSQSPQIISGIVWYYESPGSLKFVAECRKHGQYHQTITFDVSLTMLRNSLERIGGPKKRTTKSK